MSSETLFIYTTHMDQVKPVFCQGRVVYKQYEKIKNFLRQQLGEEYADLFSEPMIPDPYQVTDKGSWQTTLDAAGIATLAAAEKSGSTRAFETKLATLIQYCDQLLKSSKLDERNWGELLRACLIVPDKTHIFINQQRGSLVAWGFEWNDRSQTAMSLSKDVHFLQYPIQEEVASEKTPDFLDPDKKTPSGDAAQAADVSTTERTTHSDPVIPPSTTGHAQTVSDTGVIKQAVPTSDPHSPSPDTGGSGGGSAMNKGCMPGSSFWEKVKKYWWWLLLLLLFLLVVFFISTCNSKVRYLPAKPGIIVPIDSTKIVEDTSSHSVIISNRLNVALVGDNKSVDEFARTFKSLYPSDEYMIIYYDTTVHRVQIQVPDNKRESIKQDLKNQMTDFKLLIWNESLFKSSRIPADAGFAEVEKSWYMRRIGAPDAWDVSMGDSNLVIAVIDDGFDLDHEELKGRLFSPWNVVTGNADVNTGKASVHGTHVAGTALGNADNLLGLSGVAPHCKFMPVQVGDFEGRMSSTSIIDGVLYAINHNAQVINMSLGMILTPDVKAMPPEQQLQIIQTQFKAEESFWNELFARAIEKNIVVVLAAGNDDLVVGVDPMNRSPHVINVSAVDPDDKKADFSNYGPYSTISAPGVHIYNALPDNKYTYMDGTSMASPIVAGGVALIKTVNPAMSFNQIVDLLQTTGTPINGTRRIGNLMQLSKALGVAKENRNNMPVVDCPDIQKRIDSLLQEIEKLRARCNQPSTPIMGDTMRIPRNPSGTGFAAGKWKSTTPLVGVTDGKKVTIYFDFNTAGTGTISLVHPDNTVCRAAVSLSMNNDNLQIVQNDPAVCQPPPKMFSPYRFVCKTDANGCAECEAQNRMKSGNDIRFNLVKINQR